MIERVRLLVKQLKAARPNARQQDIAAELGLSPSMLSKIEGAAKSRVQDDTLKSIIDALKLDPSFFFDESLGPEPDHRDFIRRRAPRADADPPYWAEFRAHWHRFGELTAEEREGLRRILSADHEIRDWTDWVAAGEWVLGRRRPRPRQN